jgi:hypothetical protein
MGCIVVILVPTTFIDYEELEELMLKHVRATSAGTKRPARDI